MIPENENTNSQEDERSRLRKLIKGVAERASHGCSRRFCFRELCKANPDFVPISNKDIILAATELKQQISLTTCFEVPTLSVTRESLEAHMQAKNKALFSGEYFRLLFRPEEFLQLCSQEGDQRLEAPLDHDMINRFSRFVVDFDAGTKQAIAAALPSCMQYCLRFLEDSFIGLKLVETARQKRKPAGEMIEEKLPSQPSPMENRKKLLCKYLAALLSQEMLWEPAMFTEIPESLDFYRKLVDLAKGQEAQTTQYLDSLDIEQMLHVNELFQNHIAISILQLDSEEELDDSHSWLELQIELLDLLVKSNTRVRRVDHAVFVNATCSDQLNIQTLAKHYYVSKKQQQQAEPVDRFIFLEYPWLFSTAAKVDAIQYESKLAMQGVLSDMLNQGLDGLLGVMQEGPTLNIQVRRNNILDDSLRALSTQSRNFKKQMRVKFAGEEGVDQGGVKKEFFHLLMKELFNPNYAMFEQKLGGRFLWFNKLSLEAGVNFELIGSLLALAIYNSVLLPAPFPRVTYKKLLREPVCLEDLREFDPDLHSTLRNILRAEDVDKMDLYFTTSYDNWGREEIVELIPDGAQVRVTGENRQRFVDEYLDWYLNRAVQKQFDPFLKGFYKVISESSIRLLDSAETMTLICGVDELDFKEMEMSTQYENCSKKDTTVVWFWEVLHELDDEHKRMFLKFTTGSDRSPIRGLAEINLVVMLQGLDDERLPSAHTCFNHLILPQFSTKEQLRKKLLQAIENHEGFGLM